MPVVPWTRTGPRNRKLYVYNAIRIAQISRHRSSVIITRTILTGRLDHSSEEGKLSREVKKKKRRRGETVLSVFRRRKVGDPRNPAGVGRIRRNRASFEFKMRFPVDVFLSSFSRNARQKDQRAICHRRMRKAEGEGGSKGERGKGRGWWKPAEASLHPSSSRLSLLVSVKVTTGYGGAI